MRQRAKTLFRPSIESIEHRIAASSGLNAHAQVLAMRAHSAAVARNHATPKLKEHAKAKGHASQNQCKAKGHANHDHGRTRNKNRAPKLEVIAPQAPSRPVTPPAARPAPIVPVAPSPTASTEAWVKLVNMTGQDIRYQISLGPYRNGEFLTFDLAGSGPDSVQYRYSSLVINGQRYEPSFAIKFENGPVIPLNTGISAASARGYYVFFDSNFQPYVSPFTDSKAT